MQYVVACSCVAVELERAFKYGGCNDHTYQLYYIFTDYASNNARKKITYYAGSSARILAASLSFSYCSQELLHVSGSITRQQVLKATCLLSLLFPQAN